nr:MAG TPA: hypothetical protein [Caudoviricetes sp.]
MGVLKMQFNMYSIMLLVVDFQHLKMNRNIFL